MKTLKPFPSARNTKPSAEVVFPFPSPVTTMIKPRRRLLMNQYSVRCCLAATRSGALRCASRLNLYRHAPALGQWLTEDFLQRSAGRAHSLSQFGSSTKARPTGFRINYHTVGPFHD